MKIIITGIDINNNLNIAKQLQSTNDYLTIAPIFTSDENYKNKLSENYIVFLDPNIINLSYKNNAFLYIRTEDYVSSGITLDDFYNNDIICITNKNFNQIINNTFNDLDCLIVWLDTKYHDNININNELIEINYLEKTLSNLNYLYFLDEDDDTIVNTINSYIESSEDKRKELLEEYC
jgi:hypothetical protein